MLLVSNWEIYCENVCRQVVQTICERAHLDFIRLNKTLRRDLLIYAGNHYKGGRDPLNERIARLPDGGWKQLLEERLDEYIVDFNTPKFRRRRGKNLDGLFRAAMGITMSRALNEFLGDDEVCDRLDGVVTIRGEIAHTGNVQEDNRLTPALLRQHTSSFIEAAAAVDVIIHREFREGFGFAPWQITHPIRSVLRAEAQQNL